jgi:hypothetical protein
VLLIGHLMYLEKRRRISQCNLEVEYAYILKFVSTTTKPCNDITSIISQIKCNTYFHYDR